MLPPLRCVYLPQEQPPAEEEGVLGIKRFTPAVQAPFPGASMVPCASVMMAALAVDSAPGSAFETWAAVGPLHYGCHRDIRFSRNDEILFGSIQLSEAGFEVPPGKTDGTTPLHCATEAAYRQIFELIDELGFAHILRFWNYIPDINGHTHGLERYRQFNAGRQDGFLHARRQVIGGMVPAASALGAAAGPLTVCFIASRSTAPIPVENPRQISAYHYPPEYGVRRPTFSRASVVELGGFGMLFLSGTASIVGHVSLHHGDIAAQTRETLVNIAAVLDEANHVLPKAQFSVNDLIYKVYVRHPEDVPLIDRELRRKLTAPFLYLQADICRRELLLEIEGVAILPVRSL
jgi:chorismate lyase/3-hydroxybenzoate synthase